MANVVCKSFPPIVSSQSQILILGCMPGERSLHDNEYYAHPQNQFWDIMGELFAVGRNLTYHDRVQRLQDLQIAVWDVVALCERRGSLDSAIKTPSVVPNDFAQLFAEAPDIKAIFFNGKKAMQLFRKFAKLPTLFQALPQNLLPSTSPAHATLSFKAKSKIWRESLQEFQILRKT